MRIPPGALLLSSFPLLKVLNVYHMHKQYIPKISYEQKALKLLKQSKVEHAKPLIAIIYGLGVTPGTLVTMLSEKTKTSKQNIYKRYPIVEVSTSILQDKEDLK